MTSRTPYASWILDFGFAAGAVLALAGFTAGCRPAHQAKAADHSALAKKVIILGVDGMDPLLAERLMDRGELPNLDRLRQAGGYRRLGTTIPPQSPVAWASFITGADPGTHGIFDFIHRNPSKQYAPYYSASETIESTDGWEVGEHRIPLTFFPFYHNPTQTRLRREGTPFWDYLDRAGIPSAMYDLPSNYPPSHSEHGHHCCLSGMGVPDLRGGYGTYQLYSTRVRQRLDEGGGIRKPVVFTENAAKAKLTGPVNSLLKKPRDAEIEFTIYRHPTEPLVRLELPDQTVILREGEWSDWCRVRFPLEMPSFLPNEHVPGICRFFLQEVRPAFRMYVTPINIDPSDPGEQQISEPPDFVKNISSELGLFYTAGFQEDHKALSNRVFSDQEYRDQAAYVLQERRNLLQYALRHFERGLLFFYFSSTDLQSHMFWWMSDEKHPVRDAEAARAGHAIIEALYRTMDGIVGEVLQRYGHEATVMILSDHGFCDFRRQVNLNTWLRETGYIQPANCDSLLASPRGRQVDWTRTRAYGLGLNGLYLNLRGRERDGIVDPAQRDTLLNELRDKLLALRDPVDGAQAISAVYRTDEVYHGPHATKAPDLIVGYARGYRVSWDATLGTITDAVFTDNDSAWSADHCMAAEEIPGVLFSNRPILHATPALTDIAPTVLDEFGVRIPETMQGRSVYKSE